MTNDKDEPEVKIVFAPGAFDSFEGTQEELDGLIAEIEKMATDGTLLEMSQPVDIIDIDDWNEEEQEVIEALEQFVRGLDGEMSGYDFVEKSLIEERKKKLN